MLKKINTKKPTERTETNVMDESVSIHTKSLIVSNVQYTSSRRVNAHNKRNVSLVGLKKKKELVIIPVGNTEENRYILVPKEKRRDASSNRKDATKSSQIDDQEIFTEVAALVNRLVFYTSISDTIKKNRPIFKELEVSKRYLLFPLSSS